MSDEELIGEVPDGAAIFPEIPEELGINPLWLAVLHATVFLAGSNEDIVHPDAAEEVMNCASGVHVSQTFAMWYSSPCGVFHFSPKPFMIGLSGCRLTASKAKCPPCLCDVTPMNLNHSSVLSR